MRGHIVKRGKNTYSIKISLGKDEAGKYRQKWVTVQGSKKDADRRLAEILHQLDTGTYIQPGKETVKEYLERWLRDYVRVNLSPRTWEGYEYIIRCHLIPSLGGITLTRLKPDHLQRYYSEKLTSGRDDGKGGLSAQSVRHHHMALHKALDMAVKWGLVASNSSDAVDVPPAVRNEMQIWDEGEARRFLEAARSTPYYPLYTLALYTGARRSELLALRWCDIDLLYSQIYINRSLHHLKDGSYIFRQPKAAKSRRAIALPPSASLVLSEYREKQEVVYAMIGKTLTDDDLAFCQIDGSPLRPDTITRAWPDLARRAGIKVIRLHDARHTHASLMLKQGIHPKIVQERLGHSTIAVTLDTYSHVAPGLQEAAARKFDDLNLITKDKETAESF
jgi:integrase